MEYTHTAPIQKHHFYPYDEPRCVCLRVSCYLDHNKNEINIFCLFVGTTHTANWQTEKNEHRSTFLIQMNEVLCALFFVACSPFHGTKYIGDCVCMHEIDVPHTRKVLAQLKFRNVFFGMIETFNLEIGDIRRNSQSVFLLPVY